MLYQFHTVMTEKGYYEFNKYHLVDSPEMKKNLLRWKLYVPCLFVLLLLSYYLRGEEWYYIGVVSIFYALISLAWFFLVKPMILLYLKCYLKRMKKKGKLLYSKNATLDFYEDYFVEVTEETKTEVKYQAVLKVRINEPYGVYIYHNAVLAYIIPFDAFKNEEERQEFLAFIHRKTEQTSK